MPRYALGALIGLVLSAILQIVMERFVFPLLHLPTGILSQRGLLVVGALAGFVVGLFWEGKRR